MYVTVACIRPIVLETSCNTGIQIQDSPTYTVIVCAKARTWPYCWPYCEL